MKIMSRLGGHTAGYAILHDDYDEESGNPSRDNRVNVRMPNDNPMKWASLSGKCEIIVPAKKVVDTDGEK